MHMCQKEDFTASTLQNATWKRQEESRLEFSLLYKERFYIELGFPREIQGQHKDSTTTKKSRTFKTTNSKSKDKDVEDMFHLSRGRYDAQDQSKDNN
ncbi:hypothetical protein SUGI_0918310 [Cryptomeria japonica]|nr:hypothetical protein SUGI_0918310 [Cryptomeria japonica]